MGLSTDHGLGIAFERILTLKLTQLSRGVLVEELVHRKIATANFNLKLVTIKADVHFTCSKLVYAL